MELIYVAGQLITFMTVLFGTIQVLETTEFPPGQLAPFLAIQFAVIFFVWY